MLAEKGICNRFVFVAIGIVSMPGVGVELFVSRCNCIKDRIACFRRADIIIQPDVDDDRAADAVGKMLQSV